MRGRFSAQLNGSGKTRMTWRTPFSSAWPPDRSVEEWKSHMFIRRHPPQPMPYHPAPDETHLTSLRDKARVQITLIVIAGLLAGMALGGGTYLLHKNWAAIF